MNKMQCYVAEDLLPEYVEGLCSEQTGRELEAHLQDCESCRKKMEEMRREEGDTEKRKAVGIHDIEPFRKIDRELKKNRLIKVAVIVLLIAVCGVFGVLTVGQIFPELDCPSYDTIMYRIRAKQIAQEFVSGDMREILRAGADGDVINFGMTGLKSDEHDAFFVDVADHLTELQQKVFKDKEVSVRVDGIYYGVEDYGQTTFATKYGYGAKVTVVVDGEVIDMQISFGNAWNRYLIYVNMDGFNCDNNIKEGTDLNQMAYQVGEMEKYLDYYVRSCLGFHQESVLTNTRISSQTSETLSTLSSSSGSEMYSYYFTKDCMNFGIDKEGGVSEYSQNVGNKLFNILKNCRSNRFELVDRKYNAEAKKYDATLYWRVIDLNGKECTMIKEFYFGMTGYEQVDDTETVYTDDGVDRELVNQMETVFD